VTECVLIADDLTGACDSAGPFATAGLGATVALAGIPEAEVVALTTDSRDVDPDESRRRLAAAGEVVRRLAPRIIFKKIDSTLRGNTRHEIEASLDVFDCDAAVVTPAFPAMGRVVESGRLRLTADPCFPRIDLRPWFDDRFEIADAISDADLDALVDSLVARRRVLWVGSAGLSGALARRLRKEVIPPAVAFPRGRVLFCIGSDHPVTIDQMARLRRSRDADVLPIPRNAFWGFSLPGPPPAALFLCGGDTASLVCTALGVERIDIVREFAPGIPIGILRGGVFDGVPVITKSGGFGQPDDLVSLADEFSTL
jgi:uncharacterized protein YgbK (DUF1537 family)